jgi:hypothetical protein
MSTTRSGMPHGFRPHATRGKIKKGASGPNLFLYLSIKRRTAQGCGYFRNEIDNRVPETLKEFEVIYLGTDVYLE